MQEIKSKFSKLEGLVEDINEFTLSFTKIDFFKKISVKIGFNTFEGCFKDLLPWLYIVFKEASIPNLGFVDKKLRSFEINLDEEVRDISKTIHAIRTVWQHNTYDTSQNDLIKRAYCEHWFKSRIEKYPPSSEEEWKVCLDSLLLCATSYLDGILLGLKNIYKSEHLDIIVEEWDRLVNRSYSPQEYEIVLEEVLKNHGMADTLDTHTIAVKNYDVWRAELAILKDGFSFDTEAYKIIERFVLKKELCPLDGRDLISLGYPRDENLKLILTRVREEYYRNPCDKATLVSKIKKGEITF